MNKRHFLLRAFRTISAVLALGISVGACAGLPGVGGTSWKEEVLLHDGSKIVVKRSQSYGGRHEIGQTPPIKEQDITFTLPDSGKTITWKSEYGEDIGRSNFKWRTRTTRIPQHSEGKGEAGSSGIFGQLRGNDSLQMWVGSSW